MVVVTRNRGSSRRFHRVVVVVVVVGAREGGDIGVGVTVLVRVERIRGIGGGVGR